MKGGLRGLTPESALFIRDGKMWITGVYGRCVNTIGGKNVVLEVDTTTDDECVSRD